MRDRSAWRGLIGVAYRAMRRLLAAALWAATWAGAEPAVVEIGTPVDAPEWALLERQLITAMDQAAVEFYDTYVQDDGTLRWKERYEGGMNSSDDAYEGFRGFSLHTALGGSLEIDRLHRQVWEGITRQFTRYGQIYREFDSNWDWMHHGEGYTSFYPFGLTDPGDEVFRDRSERFAQMEPALRFFEGPHARTVDLYLAPTRSSSSEAVEIVVQLIDKTAEIAAQESERALRNRLAHYHRVSLVGAMAAGIAHEVNQPLGAIANYAQACRNQVANHTELARTDAWLEKIIEQSSRASEVIRHLRTLAGGQRPERELLLPEDILRRTVQLSRRLVLDQDVDLQLDVDEALPVVRIDLVQIQQVLLNLLNNAIEALDSRTEPGPRRIVLRARRDGSTVRFSVHDSGPGIDPETEDRLLDPFFTSKPDGMGMGLAICNSILEAHEGKLWFENHPDGGAMFHVDLPAQHGGES